MSVLRQIMSLSLYLRSAMEWFPFLFLYFFNLNYCLLLSFVFGKDSLYRHGYMELTRTHGIDMDAWN